MKRSLITAGLCLAAAAPAAAQGGSRPLSPDTVITLSLGQAVRLAAGQALPVAAARARADQAAARTVQQRASLLPSLAAVASQGARTFNTITLGLNIPTEVGRPPLFDPRGQVEGPVDATDLRAHFSQNLVDLAALGRVRGARAATEASVADVASTADQAAAAAADVYVRLLRATAQLQARSADSALATELVHIAQSQLAAGVGVRLDVTRAQAQLATARSELIRARSDRDRAELELLRALDLPLGARVHPSTDLADSLAGALPAPAETVQSAVAVALAHRADLRTVDLQLTAVERQAGAIRAERLPALSLFGDYGSVGGQWSHVLSTYSWGLQLSVPVFDGLRREGRIEEQQAVADELDARRRDLRRQAEVEVRQALLDVAAAREALVAAAERLRLAEAEVFQARERFRAGVAGSADVTTASFGLTSARTFFNDALAARVGARIALARAQGLVTEIP